MPPPVVRPRRNAVRLIRGRLAQRKPGGDAVPARCLILFLLVWGALGVAPSSREDWVLENLPTFLAVPGLVAAYPRFRFSDRAYVQLTAFLLLHAIGSHFTYSEVPLGDWLARALGLARNHYDRIVHFAFGLLVLRPARELAFRGREPGRLATLALSVASVAALSALYEILEWAVAAIVDPEAGIAFLGTQGDVWDAQKDMTLAAAGALVAAGVEAMLESPPREPPARASR